MISVETARQRLFEFSAPEPKTKTLTLDHSLGCRAAQTLMAREPSPPWDNSAMDGYAIYAETTQKAGKQFTIQTEIAAGDTPTLLESGRTARIFTGAPMPDNANAVVIQENCEYTAPHIRLTKPCSPRDNVRPAGQDVQKGDVLIRKGDRITPQKLTLLASCGYAEISVFERLRIGIISTGSELVNAGEQRPKFGLYNSNGPMLKALCAAAGADVVYESHVVDDFVVTRNELNTCARECDVILTSGGVSVGDKDHVKAAIEALGKLTFWKIQMKPGKPFAFGLIGNQMPILSLPGNPASAFVTFLLFGKALIARAYQQHYEPLRASLTPADFHTEQKRRRPEYARAILTEKGVQLCPNQSSGMISPLAQCDGLTLLEEDRTIARGELLHFYNLYDLIHH